MQTYCKCQDQVCWAKEDLFVQGTQQGVAVKLDTDCETGISPLLPEKDLGVTNRHKGNKKWLIWCHSTCESQMLVVLSVFHLLPTAYSETEGKKIAISIYREIFNFLHVIHK